MQPRRHEERFSTRGVFFAPSRLRGCVCDQIQLTMRHAFFAGLAILTLAIGLRADTPNVYAIRGARIVTAAGAPIESGTVVIRRGTIDAVGASVAVPADAAVIDGAGLTVYPGLIDLG